MGKKLLVAAGGVAAVNYAACHRNAVETGNRAYQEDLMVQPAHSVPLPRTPPSALQGVDAAVSIDAAMPLDATADAAPKKTQVDAGAHTPAKKRDAGREPMIHSGNLMAP